MKPKKQLDLDNETYRRFPQQNAAASLKPKKQLDLDNETYRRFPQQNAAASLKPTFTPSPFLGLLGFSAAERCGLIEASFRDEFRFRKQKFSAAERCGLIEAAFVKLN